MKEFKVWDPLVRIFHWSLVAGFAANVLIIDEDSKAHEWVGYAILALIVIRILWGLIGPRTARFASFLPSRAAIMRQIADMATRRKRAHLGHSPLGALMIFNLLATLLALGVTGHMMTTNAFWGLKWLEELHEMLATWSEISVLVHVAAVVIESRRTGVNLPRSMITGRKAVPEHVEIAP